MQPEIILKYTSSLDIVNVDDWFIKSCQGRGYSSENPAVEEALTWISNYMDTFLRGGFQLKALSDAAIDGETYAEGINNAIVKTTP